MLLPAGSSALHLIETFLAAVDDPDGGETLYDIHAPCAIIRHEGDLCPAREVDRTHYAATHRQLNLLGREALPRFGKVSLLEEPLDAPGAETVIWFELLELRDHRPLIAASGVRWVDGSPRIDWCTLAARTEPWSYRDGLLQTLADYPWMRGIESAHARILLDASYLRRHANRTVSFSTLPEARFTCQMSTVCCKHDFEITLPRAAQRVIDAMPWDRLPPPEAGTQLPERADGQLQLKTLNETCRFLGPLGQCVIHQTLKRQPFGPCAIFPFAFAQTPEGIAVGLSPICGSARLGLGAPLKEREDYLRERLGQTKPRQTQSFRLTPRLDITWEQFRDIEKGLCEVLAAHELPMRQRLYVATRLLGSVEHNQPIDLSRWLLEPPVQITDELRAAIHGMLLKVLKWDRATLRTLPPSVPAKLFELEAMEPAVIAGILQNTLFCKVYSYPFDLTTAVNFLIVLYLLALTMQAASTGPLSDIMWRELGSLGVHGLLRSVLHEGMPEGFRALFGTVDFGQWMLAA